MSELLAHLAQWAVEVIYAFGYGGVFVLVALANLHLPIPTELTLSLAGFLVGQGRFSFVLVLVVSTVAAVAASLVLYALGLCISEERLRQLIKPIERFKILYRSDLDKASKVFERHGGKAILIGHLIPSVGALISIPAGIKGMPVLGRFMTYTVVGCALWNGVFIVLGWVLGAQWVRVEQYMPISEYVLLAAIVVGIFWFVWHRLKVSR